MADLEEVLSRQLAEGQLTQAQYDRLMRKLQAETKPRMAAAAAGTIPSEPDDGAIQHLNRLQLLSDQLYRTGVLVYLALLVAAPIAFFLVTPLRRWLLLGQSKMVA